MENTNFFTYKDIVTDQVRDVNTLFETIIKENNIQQVIEIGTGGGGLTLWFNDNTSNVCEILTFDWDISKLKFDPEQHNKILYKEADCFEHDSLELIKEYINKTGQTLILCDGNEKSQEFNFFGEYLQPNDIIMVNSYYDDENRLWPTIIEKYKWSKRAECLFEDIYNAPTLYNLSKYLYDDACQYLWGCFKKND